MHLPSADAILPPVDFICKHEFVIPHCCEQIMTTQDEDFIVVFRRFRRTKSGKVLDARQYGFNAWPIKVRRK